MSSLPLGERSPAVRPLAGRNPVPAGAYNLAELGYIEQEFVLSGTATSYRIEGDRSSAGRWAVRPHDQRPYSTRLIVRRPASQEAFSGTVLVEWLNVSGGLDAAPDWMLTHAHLIRRGHAWAGVSAQRAGIEGGGMIEGFHLKKTFPDRYAELSHPGDAWSFDIFSQAGRTLSVPGDAAAGVRHTGPVLTMTRRLSARSVRRGCLRPVSPSRPRSS
ncbi:MAG: alpha/beta hydrolase domain-containing protein [Streptosporangiaceae bacterium]